jgi:hypothetical protein
MANAMAQAVGAQAKFRKRFNHRMASRQGACRVEAETAG